MNEIFLWAALLPVFLLNCCFCSWLQSQQSGIWSGILPSHSQIGSATASGCHPSDSTKAYSNLWHRTEQMLGRKPEEPCFALLCCGFGDQDGKNWRVPSAFTPSRPWGGCTEHMHAGFPSLVTSYQGRMDVTVIFPWLSLLPRDFRPVFSGVATCRCPFVIAIKVPPPHLNGSARDYLPTLYSRWTTRHTYHPLL